MSEQMITRDNDKSYNCGQGLERPSQAKSTGCSSGESEFDFKDPHEGLTNICNYKSWESLVVSVVSVRVCACACVCAHACVCVYIPCSGKTQTTTLESRTPSAV